LGGERHQRSVYWLLLSPLSPQFGKKKAPLKAYTPVTQCFFYRRIFTKFRPEKNMISTYTTKGFFMEKQMTQIRQVLNNYFFNSPDFYDKF
jgi:hypothetical protein